MKRQLRSPIVVTRLLLENQGWKEVVMARLLSGNTKATGCIVWRLQYYKPEETSKWWQHRYHRWSRVINKHCWRGSRFFQSIYSNVYLDKICPLHQCKKLPLVTEEQDGKIWVWTPTVELKSKLELHQLYGGLSSSLLQFSSFSVRDRSYFVQEMVYLLKKMDSHKALLESVES